MPRHAGNADFAVAQFEIGRGAFHHVRGDREDLVSEPLACVVDGSRQGDRAAARDRAESDRDQGRVGERYDDVFGLDRPGVGSDLGENRLHTLPLGTGTGGDVDRAGGLDPHGCTLERPDTGPFDIACYTEAEITTPWSSPRAAPAERGEAADRTEHLVHGARESRRHHKRSAHRHGRAGPLDMASRPGGSCCAVLPRSVQGQESSQSSRLSAP